MNVPSPEIPEPRSPSRGRFVFWLALALSWVVLLPFLWSAVTSMPSPDRLGQTRTVPIPTLATFVRVMAVSAAEVAAALLISWPAWRRAYTARLFVAAAVVGGWFVFSTPMAMTRLEWAHRRWLALLAFALFAAGVYRLAARWIGRGGGAGPDHKP